MTPTKAFVLCAGLGTRFKPQSLFCPKPTLPMFNIPQALYSTSALKELGVNDFFYNSHHLPEELKKGLNPYFKNAPFYEETLLDSAGGIFNIQKALNKEKNFWVINGDSFINYKNTEFLEEAFALHTKKDALATLIGTADKKMGLNGLNLDKQNRFLGLSREDHALHFIGLYILNTEIFNHLRLEPLKLFNDVLLKPELKNRIFIYQAPESILWSETGNEIDFINCLKNESINLVEKKEQSFVYRTHKNWGLNRGLDNKLEIFLKERHWGLNSYRSKNPGDFVCVPKEAFVSESINLKNSVVAEHAKIDIDSEHNFENSVLVHSSQWT